MSGDSEQVDRGREYRDISEMIVLVRCSGASDSNLSRFLHVFSSLSSASTSAGDFFNCCCNYHKYIQITERGMNTCSKAGCITDEANFLPKLDCPGLGVEALFSGDRNCFSGLCCFICGACVRETVRIVDLSGEK